MTLANSVAMQYGNRLRQRVSGICLQNNKLLVVQHTGLGPEGVFWSPPGGGMEYGASAAANLKREFLEETGLEVIVGEFLFLHEYLAPPLHALELFFLVEIVGGALRTGTDPEHAADAQLIQHVSFLSLEELQQKPREQLHQILQHTLSLQHLISMRGYHKFSV